MAQYISKDATVAEINRLIAELVEKGEGTMFEQGRISAFEDAKLFLDTLEVKGVDLDDYYHKFLDKEWFNATHVRTMSEMMAFTAKHFFELGLRCTITEEDCKLIWNIGDEILNMPEEEFFKELLKRYKAQKGEKV